MIRQYASAGAVVVTADPADPRTLLLEQTRSTGERQTVAPKGRIEPGEGPLAAALREVGEEAGLTGLSYAGYLGQERYAFTDRDGTPAAKTVDWFLAVATRPEAHPRAAEGFTSARWLSLPDATATATHPGYTTHLRRAADAITWRSRHPLPYSATVDRVVQAVAAAAQPLLDQHRGAGAAVCGSAARGDYVDGWSDIDLIGYGLPADAAAVHTLTGLVAELADRNLVRISLHLADADGNHLYRAGLLYDLKLRAALRRVGTDTAVIAGTAPVSTPSAPSPAELFDGLAALHRFATDRLAQPVTGPDARRDRARRILSVACSAARLTALATEPDTGLRLSAVADQLARHHPGTHLEALLRDYDTFRQHGAGDLDHAEHLATQAPHAIGDLIQHHARAQTGR